MDVYVEAGVAADLTEILENQEAEWYGGFTDGIFERLTYDGKIMAVPTREFDSCILEKVVAGIDLPAFFVSNFMFYLMVISGNSIENMIY